jgi:hypothetical protein
MTPSSPSPPPAQVSPSRARTARPRSVALTTRSSSEALPFLIPVVLCSASWVANGIPALTDAGMVALTALCLILAVREVAEFTTRQSPGRIVLYVGVVAWFCQDYLATWFDHDFVEDRTFTPVLIARVATMHALFVLCMVAGLRLQWIRRAGRLVDRLPEPQNQSVYLQIVVVLFLLGLAPYMFFTRDSFFDTIFNSMTGFYSRGARFTFGRSGNLNFDWSGYLFELIKLGRFGGVFAALYAILIAKTSLQRWVGWCIWAFWTLMAFGSGTRGELVAMALPVVVLLFLQHHKTATRVARRLRRRVPVMAGAVAVCVFLMVQLQGQLRSSGLSSKSLDEVELDRMQGNQMFTEGLMGWERVPDPQPAFFDTIPGEGAVRAIPEVAFWVIIHPIPRALWTGKPVDPVWAWYNEVVVGTGVAGTTVSPGLVGWWYFRFGAIGMVEGALLMGALFALADRALLVGLSSKRILALVVGLGFLAWLFRCFRGLAIGELYGIVVATVFVAVVTRISGRTQ